MHKNAYSLPNVNLDHCALAIPSICLDSNALMIEELAAYREVEVGDTVSDTHEETIKRVDDGEQPVMNSRQTTGLLFDFFLKNYFLKRFSCIITCNRKQHGFQMLSEKPRIWHKKE